MHITARICFINAFDGTMGNEQWLSFLTPSYSTMQFCSFRGKAMAVTCLVGDDVEG